MLSRRTFSILQVAALWVIVIALVIITVLVALSSYARADCLQSPAVSIIVGSGKCTPPEKISAFVVHYTSYFQSAHIVLIQGAVTLSLLVFQPALRAMTWTALDVPLTLGSLQRAIDLTNSPSITSAAMYVETLRSMPSLEVLFVLLINTLSLFSPLPISAIYRSHNGPYTISANLTVGGGVGPDLSPFLNTSDVVGGGLVAGRALINARSILGTPTPNVGFAPFVPQNSIPGIWSTQVETAVARLVLDCGPSAPRRMWNDPSSIVTINSTYFSPDLAPEVEVSFAGQSLGYISNDPHLTAVYINASTTVRPGLIKAQSTVVLLAANGTLDGAQERINSTTPSSRIAHVDVLVCTSTASIAISLCDIERGAFKSCSDVVANRLPGNASTSPTGGVETYVKNPVATSIALSASPVTACYQLSNRLPMWNYITDDLLASQLPPLSFLSLDIPFAAPYDIPLTYVSNALFWQTAQALVQGMTTVWPVYQVQPVQLTAIFAASQPVMLIIVTVVVVVCAAIAAFGHKTTKRNDKVDVSTILYLGRTGSLPLDAHLGSRGELKESALKLKVQYDREDNTISATAKVELV